MKTTFGVLTASALALAFAFGAPAYAAGYMKIGDIKGESAASPSKGEEIDILSWSWGETQAAASTGLATGKRMHKPLVITKEMDKSSPTLQRASSTGKVFETMELVLPKTEGGREVYLKYELENVLVTSYQTGGGAGGGTVPTETISLNYEEIKQSYPSQSEQARAKGEKTEMKYKIKEEGDR